MEAGGIVEIYFVLFLVISLIIYLRCFLMVNLPLNIKLGHSCLRAPVTWKAWTIRVSSMLFLQLDIYYKASLASA